MKEGEIMEPKVIVEFELEEIEIPEIVLSESGAELFASVFKEIILAKA